MSDIQKLMTAIATGMRNNTLRYWELNRLVSALDGIPEYYHMDAVKAALKLKEGENAE